MSSITILLDDVPLASAVVHSGEIQIRFLSQNLTSQPDDSGFLDQSSFNATNPLSSTGKICHHHKCHISVLAVRDREDKVSPETLTSESARKHEAVPKAKRVREPNLFGQKIHRQLKSSDFTGVKRAVCVGINYNGQPHALRGCVNDALNVKAALIKLFGFKSQNILVLTDDSLSPRYQPTRQNLFDAFQWLMNNAQPRDSLFFHYSGHGGQVPDLNGDEQDGKDEVIFPMDYRRNGVILDDDLHTELVAHLPAGCRLTTLFDSCHSGSVLDLPYSYHTDGRIRTTARVDLARRSGNMKSQVILFSACKDSQHSADTRVAGVAVGAMSHAFLTSLAQNPNQSYQMLVESTRDILRKRYSQIPQMSSLRPINTKKQFTL